MIKVGEASIGLSAKEAHAFKKQEEMVVSLVEKIKQLELALQECDSQLRESRQENRSASRACDNLAHIAREALRELESVDKASFLILRDQRVREFYQEQKARAKL